MKLHAQTPITSGEIKVVGRAWADSIQLRWAPTTPSAWKKGNEYGYELIRYTLLVNQTPRYLSDKKPLRLGIIRPVPLDGWAEGINANDYAAIAAQSIYGYGFELEQYGQGVVGL